MAKLEKTAGVLGGGGGAGVTAHTALTDKEVAGIIDHADGSINNAKINAAAAIAYSKLNLTNSVLDADVAAAAAIAYTKLSLAGKIEKTDIKAAAGIEYSKMEYVAVNKAGDTGLGNLIGTTDGVQTLGSSAIRWKAYFKNVYGVEVIYPKANTHLQIGLDSGRALHPVSTVSCDLGTSSKKWRDLYMSRNLTVGGTVDTIDVAAHDHGSAAGMGTATKRMRSGLAAARPGSGDAAGDFYFATDTPALSIWDGAAWKSVALT